jgi:hypothetical protein
VAIPSSLEWQWTMNDDQEDDLPLVARRHLSSAIQ